MTKIASKKLFLRKDSVRNLSAAALRKAAGGDFNRTAYSCDCLYTDYCSESLCGSWGPR